MPCCCLRGICSAILGSKMSLEANGCLLCINKYNRILRKFGYKEEMLCMKLSGISQALSSVFFVFLLLFFFKRKCVITNYRKDFFYFFIFYRSTYMIAQDMPGKLCFEFLFFCFILSWQKLLTLFFLIIFFLFFLF